MKKDMIRIYSETFTKEELRGMSDFYATPAGQSLIAKQPDVQRKMNEAMMPRMMEVMPKIKELNQTFMAEQKAKASAGSTTSSVPAPAPVSAPTPK
jgi:hypothetical protein